MVAAFAGLLSGAASAGPLSGAGEAIGTLAGTATTSERHVMRADEAVPRSCHAELHDAGTPGADRRTWTALVPGLLRAKLDGGLEPDWDLAVFRVGGQRAVAASTSLTSTEQASVWAEAGERFVIQVCRRSGAADSVPLRLELFPLALPAPSPERFSLEAVSIAGEDDLHRLDDLGLDVTHDVKPDEATVAVYSDAERAALAAAGFVSRTLVGDMAATDLADREAEADAEEAGIASELPSGRQSYRVYEDYTSEMKEIAEAHPGLVRPLVLGESVEGRPIEGLEIAAEVERADDGRPAYLNLGLHHAREWPSGEWPIEFARDLTEGFGDDERITSLLEEVRVFVVPVVNPDGFVVSRAFGTTPVDNNSSATLALSVTDAAAYKRKNCRAPVVDAADNVPCIARHPAFGVDLNRNYGAYWGGVGSSDNPALQNYRGAGPFSEPEAQAIHELSARLHPTVVVTSHTFWEEGTWLRQPGFREFGDATPDEDAMRELGDAMAAATGWLSQLAWAIGQITGATEDWNYFAQGAYGYTPEGRGPNFHADYSTMVVDEYVGTGDQAGLGVREAFLLAGERAADVAHHGVIEGSAPPGATLRLHKSFATPTCQPSCTSPNLFVDDVLETTLEVGETGRYEWHVNPSSRPLVPGEVWTMSCRLPGEDEHFATVAIDRGERVTVDWRGEACGEELAENLAPVAGFDFSPAKPRAGQEVTFTSTATDPDGEIVAWEWDLTGDGDFSDATGPNAARSFAAPGRHEVSLRVTDDRGATDVATRRLVVRGPPVGG